MANENIELSNGDCNISVKKPKRVLHFSDGTMEEYSDTEDEVTAPISTDNQDQVDTSTMGWGPWLMYKALRTGTTTLNACDYAGEAIASFLGITTPKYQFEIEEYRRIEEERKKEANSSAGWLNPAAELGEGGDESHNEQLQPVSTEQPSATGPTNV